MSINFFQSKRKNYQRIAEEYSKKSTLDDNYYLLGSNYFMSIINNKELDDKNLDFFYDLCKEWDEVGSIPLKLGMSIESLINDERIVLGVHRTYDNSIYVDDEQTLNCGFVNNIFQEGLKNYGDLSSGIPSYDVPEPNKTITPITNILDAVICLKSSYKNSNASILIALPNEYVDNDLEIIGNHANKIYYINDNTYTIRPDYLLGLIYQKEGICTYYSKDKVLNNNRKIEVI